MKRMLQLQISHDKVLNCLVDPERIEMIRIQNSTSCALYMHSGKVYGCVNSATDIAREAGYEIRIVGAELGESESVLQEPEQPVAGPKQVAVYSDRDLQAQPAAAPQRVIDSKPQAAVVTEERKKSLLGKIRKRPRGASDNVPSGSVSATVSMDTTM